MSWFRKAVTIPPSLQGRLRAGEQILHIGATDAGSSLALTRFGLWIASESDAERIDWHRVSRARLTDGVVALVVADDVGQWPDVAVLLRDRPEIEFRPVRLTKLTDAVHDRVRKTVVASEYLPWPRSGGWVVLRQVPGADGLRAQVRLDAGADPNAAGFQSAAKDVIDRLWPSQVPRASGTVSTRDQ